jgi:hypothetical protein
MTNRMLQTTIETSSLLVIPANAGIQFFLTNSTAGFLLSQV